MRYNLGEYRLKVQEQNIGEVYKAMQSMPGAASARIMAVTGLSQPTVLKAMRAVRSGWKPNETNTKP